MKKILTEENGGSNYSVKSIIKEINIEAIGGIAIYLDLLASLPDKKVHEAILLISAVNSRDKVFADN